MKQTVRWLESATLILKMKVLKGEHFFSKRRLRDSMKPRTQFLIIVGVIILILGIAWCTSWYTYPKRDQEPEQIFPATIKRDCAPWDGAAFTVSFRYDPITTVAISIWQSPDIKLPVTFSFPDETMRVGVAYSERELDPFTPLTGKVTFWSVQEGIPVQGEFNFTTEAGTRFKGLFTAEWGHEVVYCG